LRSFGNASKQPYENHHLSYYIFRNGTWGALLCIYCLTVDGVLGLTVQHENQGSASATKNVGTSTLEESGEAFFSDDLAEAMTSASVDLVFCLLFRLHLQTATDGVKWVGDESGHDDGKLSACPLGSNADERDLLGVRVEATECVVQTELDATVRDDTSDGDAEAVVKGEDALGALGGLHQTITQTIEGLLATADIRCQTSTSVVQRVDDAKGAGASRATGSQVHSEEWPKVSFGAVLGELGLDTVLEREVEGLGREVSEAVGEVTTPEGADALLRSHAGKAVDDAGVPGHFA